MHTAIIQVLWGLKQGESGFKASLGYLARSWQRMREGGERAMVWWRGGMGQEEEMEEEGKRKEMLMSVSLAEVISVSKALFLIFGTQRELDSKL